MIVVTAPTSAIGRQLLAKIIDCGEPIRVIARDPDKLQPSIRERVEVVQGSHGDVDVVGRAFRNADGVFWLVPPDPQSGDVEAAYLDFTRPACAAFKSLGVSRVVGISALGHGTDQARSAGLVTASLAMDDMIAATGVAYRALSMPSFMDNLLRQVPSIRDQGVFFSPVSGGLKAPTCATRDIAAVAAQFLLDPSWSGQERVAVLGPEDLSFEDMARIMSDVLARPVRFQQISFDTFKARLAANGVSAEFAQGYADMMRAKNDGLDNAEQRTPLSTTPTSFRQWCGDVLKPAVLS